MVAAERVRVGGHLLRNFRLVRWDVLGMDSINSMHFAAGLIPVGERRVQHQFDKVLKVDG